MVQKRISLSSRLPAEALPLIEGNEAMLQKALNILVDNAVCYTPAGGHITVWIYRSVSAPKPPELSTDSAGIEQHRRRD